MTKPKIVKEPTSDNFIKIGNTEECFQQLESTRAFLQKSLSSLNSLNVDITSINQNIDQASATLKKATVELGLEPSQLESLSYGAEELLEKILKLPEEISKIVYQKKNPASVINSIENELPKLRELHDKQDKLRNEIFKLEATESERQREHLREAFDRCKPVHDSLRLVMGQAWIPFRTEGIELCSLMCELRDLLGGAEVISAEDTLELIKDQLFKSKRGQNPTEELGHVISLKEELVNAGAQPEKLAQVSNSQITKWLVAIEHPGLIGMYLKWSTNTLEECKNLFGQQEKRVTVTYLRKLMKINECLTRLSAIPLVDKCAKHCATERQLYEVLLKLKQINERSKDLLENLPDTPERENAWIRIIDEFPTKYGQMIEQGKYILGVLGWVSTSPDQISAALERGKELLRLGSWVGASSKELLDKRKELMVLDAQLAEAKATSLIINMFGVGIIDKIDVLEEILGIFKSSESVGLSISQVSDLMEKEKLYKLLDAMTAYSSIAENKRRLIKLASKTKEFNPDLDSTASNVSTLLISKKTQLKALEKIMENPEESKESDLELALSGFFSEVIKK